MTDIINGTLDEVLSMTWPMLFISLVLVATIRVAYLIKSKTKVIIYKEILAFCFMMYILCLFQVVTSQDINSLQGNNFDIFKEISRYEIGSRLFYKNILGNVIMFVPYGFFASFYIDLKKPLRAFLLCLVASLTIEYTQSMIGRIFDVDDIILNVTGGMIGFGIYYIFSYLGEKIPFLKSKYFLNTITILLLIGIISLIIWRVV